jgi:hypothetical protein
VDSPQAAVRVAIVCGAQGNNMKSLLLVSLMVPVVASFDDQTQQLARCEIDAAKAYPSFIDAPNGQPLAFIQLCMKAAGFDWVGFPADMECDQTLIMQGKPDIRDGGAHCFAPRK